MSKIDELIDGLEEKIGGIIKENRRLIEENRKLKQENISLHQKLDSQNNQIKQLIEELESFRQRDPGHGTGSSVVMKAEIERLVREIDICIELLNR